MPSVLAWVDHDSEAAERSQRIISLFREKETLDEMGIGPIRDAFSDTLFPGTSSIHTRLRYFLIIPWIYQHLEAQGVTSRDFAQKAEEMERDLIPTLKRCCPPDEPGILGGTAGRSLKILPSSIYWNALQIWGIRSYEGSRYQYAQDIDSIYRRRELLQRSSAEELQNMGPAYTWHPKLPDPPEGLPEELDLSMTREESMFIQDCLKTRHGDSLLAFLALYTEPCETTAFPWQHPQLAEFKRQHRELLEHARLFSLVINGSSLLYNFMLSEILAEGTDPSEQKRDSFAGRLLEEHSENLAHWKDQITSELSTLKDWRANLSRFWELVSDRGYRITRPTVDFVEGWIDLTIDLHGDVTDSRKARRLVRSRERRKKGRRSRFINRRAREQWGGHSSVFRLGFRWADTQVLLKDLFDGLENG